MPAGSPSTQPRGMPTSPSPHSWRLSFWVPPRSSTSSRWASSLGVEGLLTNPRTPGGGNGRKAIRRRFTLEFEAQAVKRVLNGRSLSEVATELGLSTGQLSTWRTEHLAVGLAEALAQRKAEEAETQRLRRGGERAGGGDPVPRQGAAGFCGGGTRGGKASGRPGRGG